MLKRADKIKSEDLSVIDVFPFGMQKNSQIVLDQDEDSTKQLQEISAFNELSLTPAAINIENSSDVIIGPVTQFHGPVTIYQNVNETTKHFESINNNGRLVKSESTSSDAPPPTEKPAKKFYSNHLKSLAIILVLGTLGAVSITGAILLFRSPEKTSKNSSIDDDTLQPLGPGAIIEKSKWGGQPALNWTTPLKHPTPLVIISHTVTPTCSDFIECSKRVQNIQNHHVGSGNSPDIGYNFIVGGDGNAYVGRGWDITNFHKANSIAICYIGNYVYDYLKPEMINVTEKLLDEGVKTGKLAKNYKLVAHNQTSATLSPGPHVYEVIRKWSHYDPSLYF